MTDSSGGVQSTALNEATTSGEGRESLVEVVRDAPIDRVVLHARGAIVTRRFQLDTDDPAEKFALVCPGVTMSAEPSSVRCLAEGSRRIHSVTTRVHIPERNTGGGPTRERLAELDRRITRLNDEHGTVAKRLEVLKSMELRPSLGRSLRTNGATSRTEETLAVHDLLDSRIDQLARRLAGIEKDHRDVSRKREAAQLQDSQTSSAETKGEGAPTREVIVVFEPGTSGGVVEISYVVGPARWWPAYTLRVENEGQSASLLLEANVAQATGEDWTNVQIGLATSEIVSDAQLPNLPSYRLGRAQPDPPRAFRPPPEGVERLFVSFDLAMGGPSPVPQESQFPTPPTGSPAAFMAQNSSSFGEVQMAADMAVDMVMDEEMAAPSLAMRSQAAPKKRKERSRRAAPAAPAAPVPQASMAFGGAPPGGGGADGYGMQQSLPSEPSRVEPSDGWLDFDEVLLAPAASRNRGKLERKQRRSSVSGGSLGMAEVRARAAGAVDPLQSRGEFDHRYDAQARADVPSDGALHRLEITQATCPASLGWRSNPREDSAIYREVTLDNPLPSPLLAGPLDVYAGGSLVANTELDSVDRGGSITAGLGIDDRLRIARNARVREESAGLLGGKREIDHFIDIEIASSLGFDAVVEVVDRIPVSRDEHVDVEMFECVPRAEEYDQSDRDAPVEGGYRWRLEVLAGDETTIRFAYRVTLRAKDELVGGNRRD